MCGIIGIWAKNKEGEKAFDQIDASVLSMRHRGPDVQNSIRHGNVALGHARLSIIDTSSYADQPFKDETGKYELVFNGEIYNFIELRTELVEKGVKFKSNSDTEVLLYLLIHEGKEAVLRLNGFFSFVFYDIERNEIIFGRDSMGIKPMILYEDGDKIILCSELSALFSFDIDKTIDAGALNHYLGLTYIPADHTILEQAFKVNPGEVGTIIDGSVSIKKYSKLKRNPYIKLTYPDAVAELKDLLEASVEKRMVADVPLGTFLSGGVDSSIISAIAAKNKSDLETFSIGFDHPHYDESIYSRQVAEHIGSRHNEFILTKKDFENEFENFLESIDEPFADSSSFAAYFLAKKTKQKVTVALSGDGADELFAGYNKHRALLRSTKTSKRDKMLIGLASKVLKPSENNRISSMGDFNRKLQKMNSGLKLDIESRYWHWCHFTSIEDVVNILKSEHYREINWEGYEIRDVSDSLIADQHYILPNDMLKKVDMTSMANSLEVRTPFLDRSVVDFANSLPLDFKLDSKNSKKILKHAFENDLPHEILYRKKRGFEIPIQAWLGDKIEDLLNSETFSKEFIENQGLFKHEGIKDLVKIGKSRNFGDKIYLIWSLIVFQTWWKKYMCR